MTVSTDSLPPVTFVVEWENAIDVEDDWAKKAMTSFQDELERNSNRFAEKPTILYLYDEGAVSEATIAGVIDTVAPKLRELADLQIVATPGLTYYKLKNHGVGMAKTDLVVFLDSDAGPQPGWLEALLAPFADPEIMAVGGFTVLGWEDILSKTMALFFSDFGVHQSHSRPYTSNDNPFSEALFKTLKYHPIYPERFGSLQDARAFFGPFLRWYNTEHRHSGLALLTPADVHYGRAESILEQRAATLTQAFERHPSRFKRRIPRPGAVPGRVWINPPEDPPEPFVPSPEAPGPEQLAGREQASSPREQANASQTPTRKESQ